MALWTPAEIATALWLDANDSATISLSGARVTRWNDKSGNGRNVTQGTSGSRPSYASNDFHAKGSITFNGSSNFLANTSVGITSGTYTGDVCVYYVATVASASGGTVLTERLSTRVAAFQWTNVDSASYVSSDGANVSSNNIISNDDFALFQSSGGLVSHFHKSGVRNTIWLNGSSVPVLAGTANSISGSAGFRIGRREGTVSQYWNGRLCEVVVVSKSQTTEDRQTLEGYLAHKWGLASNLPADHPHKSVAPGSNIQTRRRRSSVGGYGL